MIFMKNMLKKREKMINLHQLKKVYKIKALKSFIFREYLNKLSDPLITATAVIYYMSKKNRTIVLLIPYTCKKQNDINY
jgi:hypothetical protein